MHASMVVFSSLGSHQARRSDAGLIQRARFSSSVIVHHRLAVNAVSTSLASLPALPVWRTAQLSAVLASLSLKSWIS